jgi:hypothetical protein
VSDSANLDLFQTALAGNPQARANKEGAAALHRSSVVHLDFGDLGHLPVVIDRGIVIPDILEWVKDQKERVCRSASTLHGYHRHLRILMIWP